MRLHIRDWDRARLFWQVHTQNRPGLGIIQRRPPAPLIFWTALSERPGGLEFGSAGKRDRHIGHEPPLVACTCSPAKLLGFLNLVGTTRCSDARRGRSRGWHTQHAPAANGLLGAKLLIGPLNGVRISSTFSRNSCRATTARSSPRFGRRM
jgi:hypothetical protein